MCFATNSLEGHKRAYTYSSVVYHLFWLVSIATGCSHKVYGSHCTPYNIKGGDGMKPSYKQYYEKFGLNVVYYRNMTLGHL